MEREVWVRGGMFATIIVLVALILITPSPIGHPSELTSLPVLIIAMTHDQRSLVVDVTGAVQAYLYREIAMNVTRANAANVTTFWHNMSSPNDAFSLETYVPTNLSGNFSFFRIRAWLLDRQRNYFEYNVTVRVFNDTSNNWKTTMAFTFPDDKSNTVVYRVPPDDLRIVIPRRGILP